jgi:hypothetical protein
MPTMAVVRILPVDVVAKLVNISASGMLVECQNRLTPGSAITIQFDASFRPEAVPSRVVRASVSGIGPDGALRYHIGIAFVSAIELPAPIASHRDVEVPLRSATPTARVARQEAILDNRW